MLRRPGLPSDLKFASLQSGQAPAGLPAPVSAEALSTVVLQEIDPERGEKLYFMSDAILRTLVSLGGVWSLMAVFYAVPRFVRDGIYRFIARNRYAWFGQRDSCRLPTAEEKSRFLS